MWFAFIGGFQRVDDSIFKAGEQRAKCYTFVQNIISIENTTGHLFTMTSLFQKERRNEICNKNVEGISFLSPKVLSSFSRKSAQTFLFNVSPYLKAALLPIYFLLYLFIHVYLTLTSISVV